MVRSATVMRGGGGVVSGAIALEVEDVQDHSEDPVDDDDEDDGRDHGRGGGESDRGGAPPRLQTPEAAHERDQDAKHRTLADADEEAGQAHRRAGLLEILGAAES